MNRTRHDPQVIRARAAPSDECVADCRLESVLDPVGLPVAYRTEAGEPPCPACLRAIAQSRGPARIAGPRRPRRGRTPAAEATWEEGLAWAAEGLREAVAGSRRLVWISLSRRPRLVDALPRRVTGLAGAGARWVRWVPPAEWVARAGAETGPAAGFPRAARASAGDVDAADLLVLWGADPERGARSVREAVSRARDRGVPVVVVDPRVTGAARAASAHLALRPGTDVALAAAIVHGMLPGEPPEWTRPWPVARAAPLCGCGEEVMERAAAMLAGARRPLVLAGGGLAWHGDPARSVAALGRLAEESGGKLLLPDATPDPAGALEAPLEAPAPREVLTLDDPAGDGTGPEGAMVVVEGAVDLETRPAGLELAEWLAGADRVLALADRWGSTARAADLVLPTPACCERIGVVGLRHPAERWLSDRAVPRPRDLPDPWQMWRSIARRLGWPDTWFELDESALRAGVEGASTEGRAASPGARAAGGRGGPDPFTAAAPVHEELGEGPRATPMIAETYPLQAVVGEIPSWVEEERDAAPLEWTDGAVALLGPEEAQRRGVRSGDLVVVFNGRGSLEARLLVVENVARQVVGLPREAAGLLSGRAGGTLSGGGLVEVAPADS